MDKERSLSLVSAGQKVGFLFSGDSGRFHLSNTPLMSEIFVHSLLYDKKRKAILERVPEIGPSHESAFHLILDPLADIDAVF